MEAAVLATRPGLLAASAAEALAVSPIPGSAAAPLYALFARLWLAAPIPGEPLIRLRWLSIVLALAATLLLDRLWLRAAAPAVRLWTLALWTLSPCVLLYARMAAPFSLEALGAIVVGSCAVRFADAPREPRRFAAFSASLAALLYTDAAIGLAAVCGAGLYVFLRSRALAPLAMAIALAAAAYAPWPIAHPTAFTAPVGQSFTGFFLDALYTAFSFLFGESQPGWSLIAGVPIAFGALWMLYAAARARRSLALSALVAAVAAGLALPPAASYASAPARLFFLLPLVLLAIVSGAEALPRPGSILRPALLVINLIGLLAYFGARDFLNPAYLLPTPRIAALIASAPPSDAALYVDAVNIPLPALELYLPPGYAIHAIATPVDARSALASLDANRAPGRVWIVRAVHDATPGRAVDALEDGLRRRAWPRSLHPWAPLTPAQRRVLSLVDPLTGAFPPGSPPFAYETWEFVRPAPNGR